VNDIFSSLFAEKSVLTSGSRQLYIYGSVVSANTLGDANAQICPYHHTGVCTLADAKSYDLEELRKAYLSLNATDIATHASTQPTAVKNPMIPFIVEYDTRILQDPPP
jgi:exo-beta-1,3-glucanase (GH17 family)